MPASFTDILRRDGLFISSFLTTTTTTFSTTTSKTGTTNNNYDSQHRIYVLEGIISKQ